MREIRIPMDPFNPGQFYACCGLLELASRETETRSKFDMLAGSIRRRDFVLQTDGEFDLRKTLIDLRQAKYTTLNAEFDREVEQAIRPVCLELSSGKLILDWWLEWFWEDTVNLKCWAGQVTTAKLMEELVPSLPAEAQWDRLFFDGRMMKTKFGIDPRAAWNALDVGFSPNEHGKDAATFPAVELLGAIGLQGFRPLKRTRQRVPMHLWTTWLERVPARRAAIRPWPGLLYYLMTFRIAKRGQSYKYFTFAEPKGLDSDE